MQSLPYTSISQMCLHEQHGRACTSIIDLLQMVAAGVVDNVIMSARIGVVLDLHFGSSSRVDKPGPSVKVPCYYASR